MLTVNVLGSHDSRDSQRIGFNARDIRGIDADKNLAFDDTSLEFFYPRMPQGGIMFLHDYSSLYWHGAKLAVDEFCAETGEFIVLMPDKSGSAFLRRSRS